jgi:hypothetical protein
MNRIEREFYNRTKKYFPTAEKVELNSDPTLFVFFKSGENEFDVNETKVVRMLKVYTMVGEEKFDGFLSDIEDLYQILTLPGEPLSLDLRFLFV